MLTQSYLTIWKKRYTKHWLITAISNEYCVKSGQMCHMTLIQTPSGIFRGAGGSISIKRLIISLLSRNGKRINMNNLTLWQLMGPLYINLFLRCMKKPLVSTVKCTEGKDAHRGFKCDQSWCKLEKKFLNQTWSLIKTLHWEYIS